jgi:hypothetical protein
MQLVPFKIRFGAMVPDDYDPDQIRLAINLG